MKANSLLIFMLILFSCNSGKKGESTNSKRSANQSGWEINQTGIEKIKINMLVKDIPEQYLEQSGTGGIASYKIYNDDKELLGEIYCKKPFERVSSITIDTDIINTYGGIGVGSNFKDFQQEFSSFEFIKDPIIGIVSMRVGKINFRTELLLKEKSITKDLIPPDTKISKIWIK